VLVVDDTAANLSLLSELLRDEYRVQVATSGVRALQIVTSDAPPDLVLLDVVMPDMTGYEVCRRIKADPTKCHIPVIFVTALDEVDDEMRGLELGGVDYIVKPISPPIVKARVRTHLKLSEQSRSLERAVQQLREQAAELADWNALLEQRVEKQVDEVERLGRLTRFFSPSVAELILSGGVDDPLRYRRREIVVVFLDLRGFTAFTETADPEEVMGVLGEYHAAMGQIIMTHNGTLERFAGDGMMVFFNDPVAVDNPAADAVRMALEMQQQFAQLHKRWRQSGYELEMGIGIAQGYATIGAIGFEGRRDYGAIGNVTNLAARLCGEAGGGQVLVSQRVLGHVDDFVASQPVGELTLKGFSRPISVFAVAEPRGQAASPATPP
jgi:class 3 adenylate cyclase/AmiR/NasT family two-component response regulator